MRPLILIKLRHFLKSRVLQHGAFWLFAFLVLADFFSREYGATLLLINLIYTALFLWGIVLVCYLNLFFFIPRFLRARRWLWYAMSMIVLISIAIGLHFLTFGYLSDWLFPGYYFISFYEVHDVFNFVVIFLAATTLLKLAKGWFDSIEQQQRLQRLEKEKIDAELQALKAQINPHFLFNSLNSLYALSLDQDKRVSALLLKLSANMRYLLYETNEHLVLLEKELDYLENYLDLQRLRSDQRVEISFDVRGSVNQQRVVPLIFLPFVENAFKHGIKGDTEAVFVRIQLEVAAQAITFSVVNNKGKANDLDPEVGGVGLDNVRKRLDLIYGKDYELQIDDEQLQYQVHLKIPIR
jgi:sensor histidine kinase YesM